MRLGEAVLEFMFRKRNLTWWWNYSRSDCGLRCRFLI
jgi:hypothetical protein